MQQTRLSHGALIAAMVVATIVATAEATPAQTIEIELGVGYVVAGGAENPGPSLATMDGVVVAWFGPRWGLAARWVSGPGEDLYDVPKPSLDRTFLGFGHLSYQTVTFRRRGPLTSSLGLEVGFGLTLNGKFASIEDLYDPPMRLDAPDTFFGGFALEALVTRRVARHFAIKAGATYDFNFETTNLQPLVLGSIGF